MLGLKLNHVSKRGHWSQLPVFTRSIFSRVDLSMDSLPWWRFPHHWYFVRETIGHRWFPSEKVKNVHLWRFLLQYLDPADKQRSKLPVILDGITLTKVTSNIVRLPAIYTSTMNTMTTWNMPTVGLCFVCGFITSFHWIRVIDIAPNFQGGFIHRPIRRRLWRDP